MAYRSKFEEQIAKRLERDGRTFLYEPSKLKYTLVCSYTPDFHLPNDVIIEAKGYLTAAMRRKYLQVKEDNPYIDLRFVFQRNNPLRKGSKKTYLSWAASNGFPAVIGPDIPPSWFD